MKIFFVMMLSGVLILSIGGIFGYAHADIFDQLIILLPNERDLSNAPWQMGEIKALKEIDIPFSEDHPNVLIRQYGIKNIDGKSFLKTTMNVYEFTSSIYADSTNRAYSSQVTSKGFESIPINSDISGNCYAFVAHSDMIDEQSMITCNKENFLVTVTVEQHGGKVSYDNHDFLTDRVALTFAKFAMNKIRSESAHNLPGWIKTNASWWSQNKISDDDFAKGLEYMINQGIINVPSKDSTEKIETKIPTWVKTNASWWSQNKISDGEFLKSIQYLVNSGIIKINPKI